jgi:hypothetical protein
VLIILVVLTTLHLILLNKRHAKQRVAVGKSAIIADKSMMNAKERAAAAALVSEGEESDDGVGNKAFDDVTDLKNEDFIFIY